MPARGRSASRPGICEACLCAFPGRAARASVSALAVAWHLPVYPIATGKSSADCRRSSNARKRSEQSSWRLLGHASESQVRSQVAAEQAASQHAGESCGWGSASAAPRPIGSCDSAVALRGLAGSSSVAEDGCMVFPNPLDHRRRTSNAGVRDDRTLLELAGLETNRTDQELPATSRVLLE